MLEHLDRILGSANARARVRGSLQGQPEAWGVGYFRKFMIYYVRRHPKRKLVMQTLIRAKTRAEVEAGINTWYGVPGNATLLSGTEKRANRDRDPSSQVQNSALGGPTKRDESRLGTQIGVPGVGGPYNGETGHE